MKIFKTIYRLPRTSHETQLNVKSNQTYSLHSFGCDPKGA